MKKRKTLLHRFDMWVRKWKKRNYFSEDRPFSHNDYVSLYDGYIAGRRAAKRDAAKAKKGKGR